MLENGVRTAKTEILILCFGAKEYVQTQKYPLVVKAKRFSSW